MRLQRPSLEVLLDLTGFLERLLKLDVKPGLRESLVQGANAPVKELYQCPSCEAPWTLWLGRISSIR